MGRNPDLLKNMAGILTNMLKSEEICDVFIRQGVRACEVFQLMIMHPNHVGLQEYCLRVGINITSVQKNAVEFINMGGVSHMCASCDEHVLPAMNKFPSDEDVQKCGLSVLHHAAFCYCM